MIWKKYLSYGVVTVAALAGLTFFFIKVGTPEPFDVAKACLASENYHVHAHLSIVINGQEQIIPKGVGIVSPNCLRPLHTHEEDGIIHVEFQYKRDFTLGEFFRVWGQEFSKDQILNYHRDTKHDLTMTVNGQPSNDGENLILRDQQKIVINFAEKKP